jgi:hypothetical protein
MMPSIEENAETVEDVLRDMEIDIGKMAPRQKEGGAAAVHAGRSACDSTHCGR